MYTNIKKKFWFEYKKLFGIFLEKNHLKVDLAVPLQLVQNFVFCRIDDFNYLVMVSVAASKTMLVAVEIMRIVFFQEDWHMFLNVHGLWVRHWNWLWHWVWLGYGNGYRMSNWNLDWVGHWPVYWIWNVFLNRHWVWFWYMHWVRSVNGHSNWHLDWVWDVLLNWYSNRMWHWYWNLFGDGHMFHMVVVVVVKDSIADMAISVVSITTVSTVSTISTISTIQSFVFKSIAQAKEASFVLLLASLFFGSN